MSLASVRTYRKPQCRQFVVDGDRHQVVVRRQLPAIAAQVHSNAISDPHSARSGAICVSGTSRARLPTQLTRLRGQLKEEKRFHHLHPTLSFRSTVLLHFANPPRESLLSSFNQDGVFGTELLRTEEPNTPQSSMQS